ncbi:CPBP family intramembrane glutamic endopeptidase [Anaerocolumna sp. MB42-C2]|uniref:CPBP family intramembrane glutamic endopeptidase n=1 Tax=Anaerocolumna sp. MB42-C2 TaxID=3070997 RepID=UPI0027E0DDE5|nr:CPBP family intramembrane glutamic endopeptidase [Anaerocolumna sp. MB42-C2]WMJ85247.1 CPBP family intramembrane glutamic endopeptidase [Anaerocolumna sp. MB42-C2]
MKKILLLILIEIIMIGAMYGCLLILSGMGIHGGDISRIIPFASICVVTLFCVKIIDQSSFKELGFNWSVKILIIMLLFLLIGMVPLFYDLLTGDIQHNTEAISFTILYYCIVGFSEELFFRGYIAQKMKDMSLLSYIIVSSAMFAALHFISSEQINVFIYILLFLFGVFFAILYKVVGSLIPLIGFHVAWDIATTYSDAYNNILLVFLIQGIVLFVAILINKLLI